MESAEARGSSVISGRRRGRTIGFPTCNLEVHGQTIPGLGVCGERLELDFEMRIRDEMKFAGADALHAQIQRDIETFRRS